MSDPATLAVLSKILARLDAIESRLSSDSSSSSSSGQPEVVLPRSIKAFDAYCTESLDPFVSASEKLGGDAKLMGELIKGAWGELRKFLYTATACKEPAAGQLNGLLGGMIEKIRAIQKAVARNEWEKHTKTVSEGVGALNW